MENRALLLVQGVLEGLLPYEVKNSLTWSVKESTVDSYGATRLASIVAPPYARLYV